MAVNYKRGDLVFVHLKLSWPARIIQPRKQCYQTFLYGLKKYMWIKSEKIIPYFPNKERLMNSIKTRKFTLACREIEDYIKMKYIIPMELTSEANESSGNYLGKNSKLSTTKYYTENTDKSNIVDVPDVPIELTVANPKPLRASSLIFGFLGLGTMGSSIVTTLLKYGHKVNVWSRHVEKAEDFTTIAASNYHGQIKFYNTPFEIFLNSDIIFSCLPDQHVIENLIFGNCGFIRELNPLNGKGYVELSSVDSDFSIKLSKLLINNGGRYLEAQLQGSKQEADDGQLVILLAGDKSLYEDCYTFFVAVTKAFYFVGDVGNATKLNPILQMIKGVVLAAMMDGLALADRAGLNLQQVVEIFNATNASSDYLKGKCNMVLNSNLRNAQEPLKHMQKDLSCVLKLSENLNQPMKIAPVAHEVYKHGNRLGYENYDAAAVYIGARQ